MIDWSLLMYNMKHFSFINLLLSTIFRSTNCHKIGYASVRNRLEMSGPEDRGIIWGLASVSVLVHVIVNFVDWLVFFFTNVYRFTETSPDYTPNLNRLRKHHTSSSKGTPSASDKLDSQSNKKHIGKRSERPNGHLNGHMSTSPKRSRNIQILSDSSDEEDVVNDINIVSPEGQTTIGRQKTNRASKPITNGIGSVQNTSSSGQSLQSSQGSQLKVIYAFFSFSVFFHRKYASFLFPLAYDLYSMKLDFDGDATWISNNAMWGL